MFDKQVTNNTTRVERSPGIQTVNHRYAAGTEQARHLNELQDAALDNLVTAVLADFGEFRAQAAVYTLQRNDMHMTDIHYVTFTLNGKPIRVQLERGYANQHEVDPLEVMTAIADTISVKIVEALTPAITMRKFRG